MKKIILSIIAAIGIFGATSCSDMLETETSRQAIEPELDSKTDSIFFAFGVLQAMQQLADQYVFTGEMRGDLVRTTEYTDNNLRQLANFSATTANKYDSAYVYYRVINNCNYYIAHRDTTLQTGATYVVMQEYAAIKAIRAWAYLQLVRNYEKVPFVTEPLTSISQINDTQFPELDINGIVDALGPDLAQYSGTPVPTTVADGQSIGSTNFGEQKTLTARLCYIPVDVILGDLYLEAGRYAEAAKYLSNYLITTATLSNDIAASSQPRNFFELQPSNFDGWYSGANSWTSIFSNNPTLDMITYIPMAVNRRKGTTTNVPEAFGFDYYSSSRYQTQLDEIQIMPSTSYINMSENSTYYYYITSELKNRYVEGAKLGDTRYRAITEQGQGEDSTKIWINKYNHGNIILYRTATVYLHLAEALNRLGHPDAAFAILKEGLNDRIIDTTTTYITDATRTLLTNTYPFFSDANRSVFSASSSTTTSSATVNSGIHQRGAGVTFDANYPGRSPYQMDTIIGLKLAEIAQTYNVQVGATLQDSINAMEDLLCDEYALEFAFEGNRFADLCRLARHKNEAALYGSNFGSLWLKSKLEYKNPQKDLSDPKNWYLPFK